MLTSRPHFRIPLWFELRLWRRYHDRLWAEHICRGDCRHELQRLIRRICRAAIPPSLWPEILSRFWEPSSVEYRLGGHTLIVLDRAWGLNPQVPSVAARRDAGDGVVLNQYINFAWPKQVRSMFVLWPKQGAQVQTKHYAVALSTPPCPAAAASPPCTPVRGRGGAAAVVGDVPLSMPTCNAWCGVVLAGLSCHPGRGLQQRKTKTSITKQVYPRL